MKTVDDLDFLPELWKTAVADVIACTSSFYVREAVRHPTRVPRVINIPSSAIVSEVRASIPEAQEGFEAAYGRRDPGHGVGCTCRHEALLAVISDRVARRRRRAWDEVMQKSCTELYKFLAARS